MTPFREMSLKKKSLFLFIIFAIFLFVITIIVEGFSVLLIKRLGWNYEPVYLRIIKGYTSANLVGGRTEYHPWGSWNVPHFKGRIANNCFDVSYSFNAYGARDKERSKTGKNRTLVFGDSFTEGWGVDQDKILAADLERITGREFLNFGVAGSGTGGLNEYVLYRDFAKDFEHDVVMVGFYPGNDFKDNDLAAWQGLAKVYYRPFWKLTEDKSDIDIVYLAKKVEGKYLTGLEPENKKVHFKLYDNLREFSAFLNLMTVLKNYKISLSSESKIQYAYDLQVSDDVIKANLIVYDKFAKLIGDKKRYIYVVPSASDVFHYKKTGKKKVKKFEEFKNELKKQGWQVIDLIDVFADLSEKDLPDYFICDGHWNAKGDALVASYLSKLLKK